MTAFNSSDTETLLPTPCGYAYDLKKKNVDRYQERGDAKAADKSKSSKGTSSNEGKHKRRRSSIGSLDDDNRVGSISGFDPIVATVYPYRNKMQERKSSSRASANVPFKSNKRRSSHGEIGETCIRQVPAAPRARRHSIDTIGGLGDRPLLPGFEDAVPRRRRNSIAAGEDSKLREDEGSQEGGDIFFNAIPSKKMRDIPRQWKDFMLEIDKESDLYPMQTIRIFKYRHLAARAIAEGAPCKIAHLKSKERIPLLSLWRAVARYHQLSYVNFGKNSNIEKVKVPKSLYVQVPPCACLLQDLIDVEWEVQWGAVSRQTTSKYQQDAWVIVAPHAPNIHMDTTATRYKYETNSDQYSCITNSMVESESLNLPRSSKYTKRIADKVANVANIRDSLIAYDGSWAMKGSAASASPVTDSTLQSSNQSSPSRRRRFSGLMTSGSGQQKYDDRMWNAAICHKVHESLISSIITINDPGAYINTSAGFPAKPYHRGFVCNPMSPAIFTVLDGHGNYGGVASSRAAITMGEFWTEALGNLSKLGEAQPESRSMSMVIPRADHSIRADLLKTREGICSCQMDAEILGGLYTHVTNKGAIKEILKEAAREVQTNAPAPGRGCGHQKPELVNEQHRKSLKVPVYSQRVIDSAKQFIFNFMAVGYRLGHRSILVENNIVNRDFGSTAVTVAIVGRYIFTASCGDSEAILVMFKDDEYACARLSQVHGLFNSSELERVANFKSDFRPFPGLSSVQDNSTHGYGRIVTGDGGILRLIPGHMSYEIARNNGFSINMSRSLGHTTLTHCALSPLPQFGCFDILHSVAKLRWTSVNKTFKPMVKTFIQAPGVIADSFLDKDKEETIRLSSIICKPKHQETKSTSKSMLIPDYNIVKQASQLSWYLVVYSDGVGDVLSPEDIARLIVCNRSSSSQDMASVIVSTAEQMRGSSPRRIRPDNCTGIVAKLNIRNLFPVKNH